VASPAIAKAASPTGISQAIRCMAVHKGAANPFTAARSPMVDESFIGYLDKIIHFRIKNNSIRKTTNNKRNAVDLEWRSFAHHQMSPDRHTKACDCGFCPWCGALPMQTMTSICHTDDLVCITAYFVNDR
jgi:hypothetical protein